MQQQMRAVSRCQLTSEVAEHRLVLVLGLYVKIRVSSEMRVGLLPFEASNSALRQISLRHVDPRKRFQMSSVDDSHQFITLSVHFCVHSKPPRKSVCLRQQLRLVNLQFFRISLAIGPRRPVYISRRLNDQNFVKCFMDSNENK